MVEIVKLLKGYLKERIDLRTYLDNLTIVSYRHLKISGGSGLQRDSNLRPLRCRCYEATQLGAGVRFSKVPKLYGPFSGVTISFVSQERRGFKSSNFTVILLFATMKTCKKISFPKQADSSFTNGFSGPKRFRDFRETRPRSICWAHLFP